MPYGHLAHAQQLCGFRHAATNQSLHWQKRTLSVCNALRYESCDGKLQNMFFANISIQRYIMIGQRTKDFEEIDIAQNALSSACCTSPTVHSKSLTGRETRKQAPWEIQLVEGNWESCTLEEIEKAAYSDTNLEPWRGQ
eukprot:571702-Amphidinium_carterae.2